MSIFSRLFNKTADADGKDPNDEESGSEKADGKNARKSQSPGNEGKSGTMRPVAPSLQINPPIAERGAAGPVVHVGTTEAKGSRSSSDKSSAQRAGAGGAETSTSKARAVSKATARLGSNVAPAYAAPPAGGVATQTTSRSSRPPKSERHGAQAAAVPSRTTGVNAKGALEVANQAGKGAPRTPAPTAEVSGPLTLDLGSSLQDEPSPKLGAHDEPSPKRGAEHEPSAQPIEEQGASMNTQGNASPPPLPPSPAIPSEIDNVKLLHDLDEAFGAIVESANGTVRRSMRPSASPPPTHSITELRELFSQLAANHMQQVRDFMIGVRWGEAPREWIPICEPAIISLHRAAKEMELADLAQGLDGYREALTRAADATGTTIAGTTRDALLAAYGRLSDLLPEAFGLDGERGRREAIIVHALLQQVPEVRKITIDKIYAAGLASLDNLFLAKPDEIAATTGMSQSLASSIVEKVQRYRAEISTLADATRTAERKQLTKLATDLRKLHEEFETVSSAWSDDGVARKKQLRHARTVALLEVKVLLARLGEVERLGQLERLPFERKIEHLEGYLQEANQKASVA